MPKPFQISLGRMLAASACFTLAAGSWAYLPRFDSSSHPWFLIAASLAGYGLGMLSARPIAGIIIGFLFGITFNAA